MEKTKTTNLMISNSFYPLLDRQERYLLLCGGAGSGKSEFVARKLFIRCCKEGNHKFLILRKYRSSCLESVVAVMKSVLAENDVTYAENKTNRTITFYDALGRKSQILFDGLDDPEKIKSIKGITGIWMEEATEFTENDFDQLNLRLREPGPHYKQIIMSFNPDEAKAPWLKEIFFHDETVKTGPGKKENSYIHHSTVFDNPIDSVRGEYLGILGGLRDATKIKIYREGMWALAKGIIYDWDVAPMPEGDFYDEYFIGGDFGFSVNPAAVVKIYRRGDEFWLEQIIYETGLTNSDLANKMKADARIDITEPSYWDASEPKSIEELYRLGINAMPAQKGPDSVDAGIDLLKSVVIHILDNSPDITEERKSYKWAEDKNGNIIQPPRPEKFKDHAMDAVRYGIYTHMREHRDGQFDIIVA